MSYFEKYSYGHKRLNSYNQNGFQFNFFKTISYTYNTSGLDYSNNFKTLIKRIKLAWRGAVILFTT